MRKLLFAVTLALMTAITGCAPTGPRFHTFVNTLDYFSIGQNGKILLTESNSYSGDYQSLGSIIITQESGYVKTEKKPAKKVIVDDGVYGSYEKDSDPKYKTGDWKFATYQSTLERAVDEAAKMGGNAIINLKFDNIGTTTVTVSGMVIKRK